MANVCVITGGGSGMGLEAAKFMPKDKVIVLSGRTMSKLEGAVAELENLGFTAYAKTCDTSKRESVKGVVISVIISVVVILLAAIYSIGFDCLDIMKEFYPTESINIINSPLYVLRMVKESEDIMLAVVTELGMALLLCIVAAGSSVVNAIKSAKANNK